MASYSTIKRGSRGDDVERLQTLLNNAGYSLDVDGIFGDNRITPCGSTSAPIGRYFAGGSVGE